MGIPSLLQRREMYKRRLVDGQLLQVYLLKFMKLSVWLMEISSENVI